MRGYAVSPSQWSAVGQRIEARIVRDSSAPPVACGSSRSAAQVARTLIGDLAQETALVLFLSARRTIIGHGIAGTGGVTQCVVEAASVYRLALLAGADSIIFAHNHPSGVTEPSADDVFLTRRLEEAGKVIGVPLLDSIVVGDGDGFYSFAEHGLIGN